MSTKLAGLLATQKPRTRLIWLDITRLMSAVLILGIHWLRACYKLMLIGPIDSSNLVDNYQGQTIGLGMLPHLLIASTGHSLATWMTDCMGIIFGFGWEGVSVLIIISGFSLALALTNFVPSGLAWVKWLEKRAIRILIPFYLVALPFLAAYVLLLAITSRLHGAFTIALHMKLESLLETPTLGIILSHTLLFDPFEKQWQADFFAPAWWFIPAILLAYVAFPSILLALRTYGKFVTLVASATITIVTYILADHGILSNECWYYILLQECFNFTLGIVAGELFLDDKKRAMVERVLFNRGSLAVGLAMFVLGNIANWSSLGRPVASIIYGPGLLMIITVISKRVENYKISRIALRVDPYALYLVHQPFAYPVALLMKAFYHGYTVVLGWFVFLTVATAVASALSKVQRPFEKLANSWVG